MIDKLFTYDLINQTIIDHSLRDECGVNGSIKYKLGQILIDFLNYDFSKYDNERKKANTIFAFNHYDYGVNCDRFDNDEDYESFESLVEKSVHSLFPIIAPIYFEMTEGDTLAALSMYLLDSVSQLPYFQDYSFLSYKKFKDGQDIDFKALQDYYSPIFTYCLDLDIEPQKTSLQKYMNRFDYTYFMSGVSFLEKTVFRYAYSKREQLEYEIKKYANSIEFTSETPPSFKPAITLVNQNPEWQNREIEIIHGYTFETPKDALYCEFLKMLELGIKIRKCAVCGKYFIITGHNGKCCDNLYKDTGLTCQQVFSDRNYKNKRKQNPILKEYDKAYKRMYARYSNKKNLTSKEYDKWKEQAKQERDRVLETYNKSPSDSIVNSFKQFLGNK